MNRKVKVRKPANMHSEDTQLFDPFLSYRHPLLRVRNLKGTFVTSSGLACNKIGLIKDCCHDFNFFDNHERMINEVSRHYHAVNDNPEMLVIHDDSETYLLIHHPWQNNYYHWICEGLLRLWMVKDQTRDFILLLPEIFKQLPFVHESLELFDFKAIYYIAQGKSVLVRTLCMPKLKPHMDSYVPAALFDLRKIYVDFARDIKKLDLNLGERIYLTRFKSGRRKVSNEDEVTRLLIGYGFTVINNEDYSFFEQVSIYSHAKHLVSLHGAGLTNMLFMPAGANVLEMQKKKTNDKDNPALIFWYLADGAGLNYYYQICEPTDPNIEFFWADLIVDIGLLETNVKLMLA